MRGPAPDPAAGRHLRETRNPQAALAAWLLGPSQRTPMRLGACAHQVRSRSVNGCVQSACALFFHRRGSCAACPQQLNELEGPRPSPGAGRPQYLAGRRLSRSAKVSSASACCGCGCGCGQLGLSDRNHKKKIKRDGDWSPGCWSWSCCCCCCCCCDHWAGQGRSSGGLPAGKRKRMRDHCTCRRLVCMPVA